MLIFIELVKTKINWADALCFLFLSQLFKWLMEGGVGGEGDGGMGLCKTVNQRVSDYFFS